MARRPVIAGNWKMHNLQSESVELINGLMKELKDLNKETMPEVVVAPVFTSLYAVNKAMTDCGCGKVRLACQVKFPFKWLKMQDVNTLSSVTPKEDNILVKLMKWLTKKQKLFLLKV